MVDELDEVSLTKKRFWGWANYVKPGWEIYIALIVWNLIFWLWIRNGHVTFYFKNDLEELAILIWLVFLPVLFIPFLVGERIARLVLPVRSKRYDIEGIASGTTIGANADIYKQEIDAFEDKNRGVCYPEMELSNLDGYSQFGWRGRNFLFAPKGTRLDLGYMERWRGLDASVYNADNLPHKSFKELFCRETVVNGTTRKDYTIMPNYIHGVSKIYFSFTGWDWKEEKMIGAGCDHATIKRQEDIISSLEDNIRTLKQSKTIEVTVEQKKVEETGLGG